MRGIAILLGVLVAGCGCSFGLNPSLDISQYAHNSWTVRGGFSPGNIYTMAQTPMAISGSAASSACFASMGSQCSMANRLRVSSSLTRRSTGCSARAEVLALVGDEAKGQRVVMRTPFADDLSPGTSMPIRCR